MRIQHLASLACASLLTSAAAGQEVSARAASQETGIRCFARICNVRSSSLALDRRRCHLCCTTNCTDIVGCQDGCDRMKKWMSPDDEEHDHSEQGEMSQVYESEPMFNANDLDDDAACVLLAGMLGSTLDSDIRSSLVVASERLEFCVMPADTRAALRAAILAVATEKGLCWKPRMTAVTVIGDSPQDVLAITALFEIVWNPSEPEPLRERAGEVLESLR